MSETAKETEEAFMGPEFLSLHCADHFLEQMIRFSSSQDMTADSDKHTALLLRMRELRTDIRARMAELPRVDRNGKPVPQ